MKKTYISPELVMQLVQTENIIALSTMGDQKADSSPALVKDEFEEGEQATGYSTTTVQWESWEDQEKK
ncbi:MAG: hypothetical protein K6F94_07195 [Bacteroidaceae bacterium]|nr:hypothetical protein [Bacteroidaceae bacterium]